MAETKIARRDFLKSSVASLGSFFSLASAESTPGRPAGAKGKGPRKLVYRTLGKTGIRLPVITMGVMNSDNPNLIRAALDAGMVHLDTANGYMRGKNEEVIGEVLKGRPRDSFVVATKIYLPRNENTGIYKESATQEAFSGRLDTSLKRLGLDSVDILYHHNVWKKESVLYEPIVKAMETARRNGKARFLGISTHQSEPEVIHATVDSKFYDVILTSYNFRQKNNTEVKKAIARAAAAGLGIVGMKAIAGVVSAQGEKVDARAALKWVLQDPNVHTIVAGFTTFDQLELDLSVMEDPALTRSEKSHLEKATLTTGLYCQGCGQCAGTCFRSLPIPDLMRSYMYVYGYRNPGEAQNLVLSLRLPARVCEDCETCPVKCASGFDVPGRVRDVVRLREVPRRFIA